MEKLKDLTQFFAKPTRQLMLRVDCGLKNLINFCSVTEPHHTVLLVTLPATVMFGRNIKNKLPSFEEDNGAFPALDSRDKVMKEKIKSYADKARILKEIDAFKPGDKALLRTARYQNKLSTIWQNKIYKVVKMCGRSVLVQDQHGKQFFRNAAHVKKYFSNPEELYQKDRYDISDVFFSNFSKPQTTTTNSNICENAPVTIQRTETHQNVRSPVLTAAADTPHRQIRLPQRYADYVMN